jgi:hypothetical protein
MFSHSLIPLRQIAILVTLCLLLMLFCKTLTHQEA